MTPRLDRRVRTVAALLAAVLVAPSAAGDERGEVAPDDRVEEAIDALRRGAIGDARALVDALFVDERARTAASLVNEGRSLEAIAAIDAALEVDDLEDEREASLLVLRGRAAFDAAASDLRYASLYEEALSNFEDAARQGAGVGAALRASRAARMVGDGDRALELARSSVEWIDGAPGRADELDVDQPFARTWSEAAFGSYVAAQTSGEEGEEADATRASLFAETRAALERAIGEQPTDPWAYRELAKLFQWEERGDDALKTLDSAVTIFPDDEATHTAFARMVGDRAEATARANGADDAAAIDARYDAVIGRYAEFRATHPENPFGYWYGGFEAFYRAVDGFETAADVSEYDASGFVAAEALFQGCRERAAEFSDACIDYEILCRLGAGWSLYRAEKDEEAVRTFFSTEDLRTLGSESNLAGRAAGLDMTLANADGSTRLPSALAGLDFVTRRLQEDPTDREGVTRAAALGDRMFAARPDNENLANNAGFLNRDAGVLWETDARRRFHDAETDEDRAAAEASRARAQELMEKSWSAYQVAAGLLPDDVRVVNDAGLVMAYYLRTDAEAAERYFLDAATDGEVQLREEMPEDERLALEEAYGDAHQNMGIIEMTLRGRPELARDWFVKSLEIGPPSRNWLRTDVLPLLDLWIETGEKPKALAPIEHRDVWVHNP
ncbi:MAG: tetratricopeptide repeat protein [Planctomycetota bacterium]